MIARPLLATQLAKIHKDYSGVDAHYGIVSGKLFIGNKDNYYNDASMAMHIDIDEHEALQREYAERGRELIEQMIAESELKNSDGSPKLYPCQSLRGVLYEFVGYFAFSADNCEFFNLDWREI